eukprot:gene33728-36534_t
MPVMSCPDSAPATNDLNPVSQPPWLGLLVAPPQWADHMWNHRMVGCWNHLTWNGRCRVNGACGPTSSTDFLASLCLASLRPPLDLFYCFPHKCSDDFLRAHHYLPGRWHSEGFVNATEQYCAEVSPVQGFVNATEQYCAEVSPVQGFVNATEQYCAEVSPVQAGPGRAARAAEGRAAHVRDPRRGRFAQKA